MQVIIDLIEDIRESIGDAEDYTLYAGLLKEDKDDASKLIYAGEVSIASYVLDNERKELRFSVGNDNTKVTVGALVPSLLLLDMHAMMYLLKMDVNVEYKGLEIVGFGKSEEDKRYILFIRP